MLFHRGSFTGPQPLITIGNVKVARVCHTRLLGITIDRNITWTNHYKELKNNFVNKLKLLKKCSFLKRQSLLGLYFKMILLSVLYENIQAGKRESLPLVFRRPLYSQLTTSPLVITLKSLSSLS